MTNEYLDEWRDTIHAHITFAGWAVLPEKSQHNQVGIRESTAEALAKENNWTFEVVPFPVGNGAYLRMFRFSQAKKEEERNGESRETKTL